MEEQQCLLRLPAPLVERMKFALSSTKRREATGDDIKSNNFGVQFRDGRNASFFVDDVEYPASLMDLPTLVETHKTADKRTFYKSGDLHQVLVVRMPDEPAPDSTMLPHGLTPAASDAARRLAPSKRLFSASQVESVEHRVKYVIDHKVKIVPKKDKPPVPAEEEEVVIEEETTFAPAAALPAAIDTATKPPTPAADTPRPPSMPATPASVGMPPTMPTPADMSISALATPGPSELAVGTPLPVVPSPAAFTPMPESEAMGDDDDDDDDDFAEMAGAIMEEDEEEEARKRIERANLDQKIRDQKAQLEQLEARAAKAPNPVLRTRILSKRGDMQKTLKELEESRAGLGDS